MLSLCFPPIQPLFSWNPDYAYNLPTQRRMCAQREADDVRFSSIMSEEDCPAGSERYLVVFGREPRGSIALLKLKSSREFYPPLNLTWPPEELFQNYSLWHFTCIGHFQQEVLGTQVDLMEYRGEITASSEQDCKVAADDALLFCQKNYRGEALLEECPLSW